MSRRRSGGKNGHQSRPTIALSDERVRHAIPARSRRHRHGRNDMTGERSRKVHDLKFEALRNAIYHSARRGVFDFGNRFFSFVVIFAGAAAVGDIGQGYGIDARWLAFVAAIAGTIQLVAGFGVLARNHEFLQRQYYELIADITRTVTPTAEQEAEWEARLNRIYAEEPPPMRALDAIAFNAACESLGLSDYRLKVTWWQSLLRHVWMFNSSEFPYERPPQKPANLSL